MIALVALASLHLLPFWPPSESKSSTSDISYFIPPIVRLRSIKIPDNHDRRALDPKMYHCRILLLGICPLIIFHNSLDSKAHQTGCCLWRHRGRSLSTPEAGEASSACNYSWSAHVVSPVMLVIFAQMEQCVFANHCADCQPKEELEECSSRQGFCSPRGYGLLDRYCRIFF